MRMPLATQGITDGSQLTLVRLHMTKEQQLDMVQHMYEGRYAFDDPDMDILNTITDLFWYGPGLDNLILPSGLQSLTFGYDFNQRLDNTTLQPSLHSLTFVGYGFDQSLDNTTLPSGLLSLTFGYRFNQNLDNATLASGIQSLTFCYDFNQSLNNTTLPSGLWGASGSIKAWTTRLCQAACGA